MFRKLIPLGILDRKEKFIRPIFQNHRNDSNDLTSRKFSSQKSSKTEEESSGSINPLVIVPIVTFGLGCWQVYRLKWKLGLIESLERKTSMDPIDLPLDLSLIEDLECQPVRVKGYFDHDSEILISPRWLFKPEEKFEEGSKPTGGGLKKSMREGGGLISSSSKDFGHWVITPFILNDRPGNQRIIINRGWVPRAQGDPATRPDGQVKGEVELVGIVRKSEPRKPFEQLDKPEQREFHSRDLSLLSHYLKTLPVFLDASADSTVPGGPTGGQTRVTLRNEHLNYIITWWGLSIFTAYLWYKKIYRKPAMKF